MLQAVVASGQANFFDQAVLSVRESMRSVIAANPQLRELDTYALFAVSRAQQNKTHILILASVQYIYS